MSRVSVLTRSLTVRRRETAHLNDILEAFILITKLLKLANIILKHNFVHFISNSLFDSIIIIIIMIAAAAAAAAAATTTTTKLFHFFIFLPYDHHHHLRLL